MEINMNDETKYILNRQLIVLDKSIQEYTQDIEELFLAIKEKTDFRATCVKRRNAIYEDLNAKSDNIK